MVWTVRDWNSVSERDFLVFSETCRPAVGPIFCSLGIGGLGVNLTANVHLVPWLRMGGALPYSRIHLVEVVKDSSTFYNIEHNRVCVARVHPCDITLCPHEFLWSKDVKIYTCVLNPQVPTDKIRFIMYKVVQI